MCPRCSASISAYIEVEPEVARAARGPAPSARRGRPRPAPRTTWPPPPGPSRRPSHRRCVPSAGKRAVRPSGSMPTQLMPAPQTTATPARLGRRPARRIAKVSLRDLDGARPSRARCSAAGQLLAPPRADRRWPGRPRRASTPTVDRRPRGPPAPRRPAVGERRPTAASTPDGRRLEPAAARRAEHRPVRRRPPPRRSCCCPRRWRGTRAFRPTRGAPGCARSACRSAPRRTSYWPISGWASSALKTRSRPPRRAASSARSSYAVTCAISPAYSGSDCGARAAASAPSPADRGRHLDHRVVRQEGQRAVVVRVHHLRTGCRPPPQQRRRPGPRPPPSRRRRRAWPAAPASRPSAGSPYICSSSRSIAATSAAREGLVPQLPYDLVVRVVVAQVVGGDDAEPVQQRARQAQVVGDRRRRARPAARGSTSSPSGPPRRTPVSQVRWLRPDVVEVDLGRGARRAGRRTCAGSRSPRCTARPPCGPACSSARVTMPTGLVKSMIQASGLARRTRSAMSRTTGTVRSALARPPAPVVSWPTQPHSSGQVSSCVAGGLAADAQLEQHGVGARDARVQVGGGDDPPGVALLGEDPPGEPADQLQAVGRRVDQHQFLDGRVSRSRAKPSMSSGV